jgi:hypothetical protein
MPTTRSAQKKTKIVIAKKKRGVKHKKISSTSKKSTIKDKLTNIEESIKKIGNEPEFNQTHSNENVILTTKVSSSTQDDKIYNVRLVDGLFNLKFTCDCGFQFGVGERTSCKHINSVFIKLLQAYKIGLPKSKKINDEIIKMMKTLSF